MHPTPHTMSQKVRARASQDFVPIEEVRDGVVVLKDGGLRAVLMASSLNFMLKSQDEQKAIIGSFQSFLNSLDFSVQFVIESRELDIRPYLATLENRYMEQTSELMKIQVREYIDFVKGFVEDTNIMTKSFFVVVPYTPVALTGGSGLIPGFGKKSGREGEKAHMEAFEEHRSQLEQRISIVSSGLSRSGIRLVQLGTEEVIELYYKIFNIGELERPMPFEQIK